MKVSLLSRRPASRPRRRIIEARNHWRVVDAGQFTREVLIRDYDGQVRRTYLPDEHPALVRFLERAEAAAA
jgi:hypothetical protein